MKSRKFLIISNLTIILIFLFDPVSSHAQSNSNVYQDSNNTFQTTIKVKNLPETTFKPYVPVTMNSAQVIDTRFEQNYEGDMFKFEHYERIRLNMEAHKTVKKWMTDLNKHEE